MLNFGLKVTRVLLGVSTTELQPIGHTNINKADIKSKSEKCDFKESLNAVKTLIYRYIKVIYKLSLSLYDAKKTVRKKNKKFSTGSSKMCGLLVDKIGEFLTSTKFIYLIAFPSTH